MPRIINENPGSVANKTSIPLELQRALRSIETRINGLSGKITANTDALSTKLGASAQDLLNISQVVKNNLEATGATPLQISALSGSIPTGAVLLRANNLSDLTNVPAARTNLGLGTAATQNSTAFDPAGAATAAVAAIPNASATQTGLLTSTDWSAFHAGTPLPTGPANEVVATPNGSAGVAGLRLLVAADIPSLPLYLLKASNLSDVANAATSRTNLLAAGLPDANVFTALNTYTAGALYKTPIGIAQLILDGTTAAQQVVIQFFDNGVTKWLLGKATDQSFFLYDQVQARFLLATDPATGNLTIAAPTTITGALVVAASGQNTTTSGKTITFYNTNTSLAAIAAADNTSTLNAMEITKAAAVVSVAFPNGPVTFTVAPVFTDQSGSRTALGLGAAALLAVPIPVASGGTAGITAAAARTNLAVPGLATTNTFPLAQTFTVAPVFTDQSGSRTALGLGAAALLATPIPIASGGTAGITAAAARTNLAVPGLAVANTFTLEQIISAPKSGGVGVLNVTNTNNVAGTSNGLFIAAGTNASDYALWIINQAQALNFFKILGNGNVGIGTASPGSLFTIAANIFTVDASGNTVVTGQLSITTAGSGLKIKEGTNAKMGQGTLVLGTLAIANTSITANSRIFLASRGGGGQLGQLYVSATSVGVSFTVSSTVLTDTTAFNWLIIEAL